MLAFLSSIALFLMLAPAFLALAMASRNLLALIWNMAWFYLMSQIAGAALGAAEGRWVGAGFAFFYLWRAFTRATPPAFIKFETGGFTNVRRPAPNSRSGAGLSRPDDDDSIIDIEVVRDKSQLEPR